MSEQVPRPTRVVLDPGLVRDVQHARQSTAAGKLRVGHDPDDAIAKAARKRGRRTLLVVGDQGLGNGLADSCGEFVWREGGTMSGEPTAHSRG